ncbi:hypothetical protein VTJ49DRAFT_3303 [Mycothermus thermophilus]|uniref:Uncharacterized protein n=1 Tax=Humicola insolens TaxID=85995 RepID=A0ABR3V830_HUMIN
MLPKLMPLSPSKLAITLAILPLTISATYLVYLNHRISRECTISASLRNKKKRINTLPPTLPLPTSLPREVASDESEEWILAHERVVLSRPLHPSALPSYDDNLSTVLTHYVRATMTAFSWTPQAFILRASVGDKGVRETFDTAYILSLDFCEGDRVNGFWKIVYRGEVGGHQGSERVELALDAPDGYKGPVVRGLVVAGVEMRDDGEVVFVNETWMWRREGEAPVLLEGRVGGWLHELLSGWLVMKGVRALTEGKGKSE